MGFKVGDKVKAKQNHGVYICMDFDNNAVYEVAEVLKAGRDEGIGIISNGKQYNVVSWVFELVEPRNETIIPYAIGQKVWAVTSELSIDYKTGAKETVYSAEEFVIYSMIVHEDYITLFDENERKVGVVGKNVFTSKAEALAECDKLNKGNKMKQNELKYTIQIDTSEFDDELGKLLGRIKEINELLKKSTLEMKQVIDEASKIKAVEPCLCNKERGNE